MQIRTWSKVAAAGVVTALTLAACSSSGGSSDSGGLGGGGNSASSSGKTYKIAFQGVLSGDNQQLGINEYNAFQLAVDQANAKGDLGFTLTSIKSDDGGDPAKAPTAAQAVIGDSAVIGMIGPSFSGATKASGKAYGDAGLAFITPSATNATLQAQGFSTFHRIVPDDNLEGVQGADWLARKGLKKVFVLDDLSDYGKGVADAVDKELKAKGIEVQHTGIDAKTDDYSAIAQTIKASGADAMFYGGYDAQAAKLSIALKTAGYTGLTVTGNGGKSTVFTKGAGDAGNGWYFTCGCLDATIAASAKTFTADYKAKFNTDPSTYSPEAFDATNTLISAIKAAAAKGEVTRKSVLDAVNAADYKGITANIKFKSDGDIDGTIDASLYVQNNGAIKSMGLLKDQK